jgi:putative membrane protein
MIPYEPKQWFNLFTFKRSDTARKLAPYILAFGAYALAVVLLEKHVFKLTDESILHNVTLLHTLLGFVISMLLVFRTNTAYDRWWEGRRLWGSLVNNSRNLGLKLHQMLPDNDVQTRQFYQNMIPNFAVVLKNHLRDHTSQGDFADTTLLRFSDLRTDEHIPNQLASAMFGQAYALEKRGVLRPEHLLVLNAELQSFMDICGACERIKKTPIPYSYSSFIKKFIVSYCLTLPIGFTFSLHYLVVPFTMFVFYVLASLEVLAEEVENPFGTDENDLPLDLICQSIHKTVWQGFEHPAPVVLDSEARK